MAVNKEKLTASAMKHLQRGALDKAVKDFEKILNAYPEDERALQKVADLYARMGKMEKALDAYSRVSALYVKQGFSAKVIAVYKQILQIDNSRFDIREKLAETYRQLGHLSESIHEFQAILKHYEEQERPTEVLRIMKKIAVADANNLTTRVRLAEAYFKQKMMDEGKEEYRKILQNLKDKGREDDYVRVLDRFYQLVPEDVARGRELVQLYLERGETKKALTRLVELEKNDPNGIGTLELIAKAHYADKQLAKTIIVYRQIATILRNKGETNNLRKVYEKILSIDPNDEEAKKAIEELPFQTGLPTDSARESELEEISTASEFETKEGKAVIEAATDTPPQTPTKEIPGSEKMLTEAEVFMKYGLYDQAESRLETILENEPENVRALKLLANAYAHLDAVDAAESVWLQAALLYFQNDNTVDGHAALESAKKLKQENQASIQEILDEFSELTNEEVVERIYTLLSDDAEQEAAQSDDEELPSLEEEHDEELLQGFSESASDDEDELMAIDFDQEIELVDDVEEVDEEDLEEALTDAPAEPTSKTDEEGVDILEEVELPEHMRAPVRVADSNEKIAPPELPKEEALEPLEDIEIEEDFDIEVVDELLIEEEIANESSLKTEAKQPQTEKTIANDIDDIAMVGPELQQTIEITAEDLIADEAEADSGKGGIDLAKEIFADLDFDPEGLFSGSSEEDLMDGSLDADNEDGRQEEEKSEELTDTHYSLGVAYKEMSRLNDAIGEFLVSLDGGKALDSAIMLSACYVEKNQKQKAMEYLSRAIRHGAFNINFKAFAHYQLGLSYEKTMKPELALLHFLAANDAIEDYENLPAKIEAMEQQGLEAEDPDELYGLLSGIS